jgi:hypothetical protein
LENNTLSFALWVGKTFRQTGTTPVAMDLLISVDNNNPAIMAQWLEHRARNHKVPGARPATAMSLLGDWFTQP